MTYFVSFRTDPVDGGKLRDPLLLVSSGTGTPLGFRPMTEPEIARAVNGRNLLFAVHGFNTPQDRGARQMAAFESQVKLGPTASFFAVLWPGDTYVPYINYPFEANDAVYCGQRLAALCAGRFANAASYSFMGHSLGCRLVLEAVRRLHRKARTMCLAAAAVDRDVLTGQYAAARNNCEAVAVLSSVNDLVLQYAYPVGDFLSDLFGDGDSPFRAALGHMGPRPLPGPGVVHAPIPKSQGYAHADYLPFADKSQKVAAYIRNGFDRLPQNWPPAS